MNQNKICMFLLGISLIISMAIIPVAGQRTNFVTSKEVTVNESLPVTSNCGENKIDDLTPPCDDVDDDDTGIHNWVQPDLQKGILKGFAMAQEDTPQTSAQATLYMDHTAEHDEYLTYGKYIIYFDANLVFRDMSGGGECGFTIFYQGEPVFTKKLTPSEGYHYFRETIISDEVDLQQYLDQGEQKRFGIGLKVWAKQPWEGYCSSTVTIQWKHVYVYGTQLPSPPSKPRGPTPILVVRLGRYTTDGSVDPDGDPLSYEWDFNGDKQGDDTSPDGHIQHFWDWIEGIPGIPRVASYTVRVRSFESYQFKDEDGRYVGSDWSEGFRVHVLVF